MRHRWAPKLHFAPSQSGLPKAPLKVPLNTGEQILVGLRREFPVAPRAIRNAEASKHPGVTTGKTLRELTWQVCAQPQIQYRWKWTGQPTCGKKGLCSVRAIANRV